MVLMDLIGELYLLMNFDLLSFLLLLDHINNLS